MTENTRIPKIRFKGFTDAWESCKYEDLGNSVSGGALSYDDLCDDGANPCVLYGELYTRYDCIIKSIVYRTNKVATPIYKNDILFPQSTTVDALSLISPACMNEEKAQTSGVFVIRPYDNVDGNFIAYYTKGKRSQRSKLSKKAQGLTIVHLYYQSIKDELIEIPNYEEQTEISKFFMTLDNLITLHQRKYDKFVNIKKALLDKMFSQGSETMPKIRFKGFTDAWEQRKVSNAFKVTRGYVLAATQTNQTQTRENPYPVYSSQTKDNGLMGFYSDYLYENAITWTTDGANAGTVRFRAGKFYCTNVCGVLLAENIQPNQMIAEALNNVAKLYVSYVGNPKLMNNVMSDIDFMLPAKASEREQISELFCLLDNLIALYQHKNEKLKNIKAALLDKMFV